MKLQETKTFPQIKREDIDPNMQFATDDLRIVGWGKLDDERTFYDETTLRVCLEIPGNYIFIDDKGGRLIKVTLDEISKWQSRSQLVKLGAISECPEKIMHPKLAIEKNSKATSGINLLPVDDRYEHALIKNIFRIGNREERGEYPETVSRNELFQLAGSVRELTESVKADLKRREEQRNAARKGYDTLFPAPEKSIKQPSKKQKLSASFSDLNFGKKSENSK